MIFTATNNKTAVGRKITVYIKTCLHSPPGDGLMIRSVTNIYHVGVIRANLEDKIAAAERKIWRIVCQTVD